MPGALPLVPQLEEQQVLAFERSEIAVGFFLDICIDDLKTLKAYYERALKNSVFIRMQNTMRVRQNDKYRIALEEEIARLESRWVLPLTKAFNIFESATQFTDVPPQDVETEDPGEGVEITDSADTDIQSKQKWINEPAVFQLKSVGVKPYREAMKKLRQLRHKRTQYRYLELYLLNLGRQVINLQSNLQLIIAVIKVVEKTRELFGDDNLANNPLGRIVKEVISSVDMVEAVEKLENLDLEVLLGPKGDGGPAGNETSQQPSANSVTGGAEASKQTDQRKDSGIKSTRDGETPPRTENPPTINPTGVNQKGQKAPRNL